MMSEQGLALLIHIAHIFRAVIGSFLFPCFHLARVHLYWWFSLVVFLLLGKYKLLVWAGDFGSTESSTGGMTTPGSVSSILHKSLEEDLSDQHCGTCVPVCACMSTFFQRYCWGKIGCAHTHTHTHTHTQIHTSHTCVHNTRKWHFIFILKITTFLLQNSLWSYYPSALLQPLGMHPLDTLKQMPCPIGTSPLAHEHWC